MALVGLFMLSVAVIWVVPAIIATTAILIGYLLIMDDLQ
jgi:hypothetical protein